MDQCFRFYIDNYVLLALTGSVGIALNVSSVKILSAQVSVMEVAAGRSFICTFILLAMCQWSDTPWSTYRSKLPLILLRGFLGSTSFLSQSLATSVLPLGESAFIFNSYPGAIPPLLSSRPKGVLLAVFTALLSSLFGMERLSVFAWCGVIGCLLGNVLLAHPPFLFGGHGEWGNERIVGILFGLAGTILISFMFIVLRPAPSAKCDDGLSVFVP